MKRYIGRGKCYNSWRMRIGRFFIGFWFDDAPDWIWWRRIPGDGWIALTLGFCEIRWYDSWSK